jgi:hypothetical protein
MEVQSPEMIFSLEQELMRSLRPVQPNPEFVTRLQTRLIDPRPTVIEPDSRRIGFIIVLFGLSVGAIVIWLLRQLR